MPRNVVLVVGGVLLTLVIGTGIRLAGLRRAPRDDARILQQRLITWWLLVAVLVLALALGRIGVVVLMAVVSALALREYLRLVPVRPADRPVVLGLYLTIPLQYLWIYNGWFQLFLIFIPVFVFLGLSIWTVLTGEPGDFVRAVAVLQWGVLLTVFSLSHTACLLNLPIASNATGGGLGLVLYLVLLTELNDIAQAFWGRTFGTRKVVPRISPGKTWEGLIGGVATTLVLAVLLAPLLTPLSNPLLRFGGERFSLPMGSVLAGLIIGVGGFLGDITVSAIKRDAGVKDCGSLLPGHGGMLDRVDSLLFTAPLFFYYLHFAMD